MSGATSIFIKTAAKIKKKRKSKAVFEIFSFFSAFLIEKGLFLWQNNQTTINYTMKLREISELLNAKVLCGQDRLDEEHETAFASDLMSDVLTLGDYNPVILTGLCNMQTIRTCEMGNLDIIVLVRRKKATEEMIEEAEDEGMVVMESDFSMFKACGLLFQNGMQPIF